MVDMQAKTITLPLNVYLQLCGPPTQNDVFDEEEVEEEDEEFLMYIYKVRRCPKNRPHDWTACPNAHYGERAKRRNPLKFPYQGIICPDFKNGECKKGKSCEFAHGVFEYWLHPSRFRTRICESGPFCLRKVCFFAHTPEQLRLEGFGRFLWCDQRLHADQVALADVAPPMVVDAGTSSMVTVEEEDNYCDFPHIDWVIKLVDN